MLCVLLTSSRFSHAPLPNRESFFHLQQTALKKVFTFFGHVRTCSSSISIARPLWGFSIFCLHIVACIFSFTVINIVFMPPFDLKVARKCNTPVEPTTQTAAEHAGGGIQKCSNDELDLVPNKLCVTFPSTGVPCPLPPSRLVTPPSSASPPRPSAQQVGVLGPTCTVGSSSWAAVDGANLVLPGHGQLWHCKTHGAHMFRCAGAGGDLRRAHTDPHGMSDLPGLLRACAAREVGCLTACSGSRRSASSI